MFNQCCCCYSKPILDVADNKFAESAAVLMLIIEIVLGSKREDQVEMVHEVEKSQATFLLRKEWSRRAHLYTVDTVPCYSTCSCLICSRPCLALTVNKPATTGRVTDRVR
jgi:uncharacterized Fe-S cluster-containing radical SAM superfamily enzyme